ncbi:MAG: lasso RiPP family leader peptide-containing protein [bacterium]|nr:lasso RiPP family leader peptide-containing protein [Candidatus Kapabacteria bacterium]
MNFDESNEKKASAGHERLPYEVPRLIAHGTLEDITRDIGKNSGAGDVDLQSGGAG